ncbi:hypothetical protein [Variovorax sp. Sphag1AA]|uniref:hypothetical protein n=1 Tax=Variovorax sp. Sphag1AA TaxID=2587027 RepID=UPI00160E9C87|nr:hypothetical protein [Variovorax sp. Sphag1AA]MBB3181401.1 hypothetical protein [Variovorax sp. Sphag1AA]
MQASSTIHRLIATTAALWLVTGTAHAQQPVGRSRAEVQAEAVSAAHAPDQNVTRGSRGAEKFTPMADPGKVYEQAVDTARAPDQNVVRGSRGAEKFTPMADPEQVYRQAVSTASAPDQNVNSGSRVNSKVISTMSNPAEVAAQTQPGLAK